MIQREADNPNTISGGNCNNILPTPAKKIVDEKPKGKYDDRKDINGNPMPYHYLDNMPNTYFSNSSGSDPYTLLDD